MYKEPIRCRKNKNTIAQYSMQGRWVFFPLRMRKIFVRKMITCRKVLNCRKLLVDRQHGRIVSVDLGGGLLSGGWPAFCRAQLARRKGQERATAGSMYWLTVPGPRAGGAQFSARRERFLLNSALSRQRWKIPWLQSPVEYFSRNSRAGFKALALSTWVTLTHLVPLPPLGSCLPPAWG